MPAYPIEPDKLLDAADLLAPPQTGPGRPPYTAHRRAVSTAYYAVFHAVADRVSRLVFPAADERFRQRVRRWIGHGDMKTVSRWIAALSGNRNYQNPPRHIRDLLTAQGGPPRIDADTIAIAEGFLELNEKRELADYDHEAVFGRADTLNDVILARRLVATIGTAQSDEVLGFFGLIALQAQIRGR